MENDKIIKEKLCNDKKCGWNEVDALERNKIFSFAEEYMSFMNKSKTEREATKTVLSMLKENGFKVIHTSKSEIDFLKDKANFEFDVIITNPPYSLKNEFLKKCYEYNKPFALLLPLTALEGKERGKLYKKYGIEVIVLDKRINFMKEKKNVWFNTSWFCHKICDKLLNFEKVGGEDE